MESAEISVRSIGMKWTWVTPDRIPIYLSSLESKAKLRKHIHYPGSQIPQMWLQKTFKVMYRFPVRRKEGNLFKKCNKTTRKTKLVAIRSFYACMYMLNMYTHVTDHSLYFRSLKQRQPCSESDAFPTGKNSS